MAAPLGLGWAGHDGKRAGTADEGKVRMSEGMGVLGWALELAPALLYLLLALGAALENIVPPIPADTFVVVGGVLAARGTLGAEWVFVVTWSANVASALLVYAAGRRYGARFFQGRLGRRLLSPGQLEQVEGFFRRWGVPALILTRFLPGVRAVVPGFAGVSRLRPLVVVPTLAAASAVWYGTLTWAGTVAGANLPAVLDTLAGVNRGLLVLAVAVGGVLGWWWRRSRRRDRPEPR